MRNVLISIGITMIILIVSALLTVGVISLTQRTSTDIESLRDDYTITQNTKVVYARPGSDKKIKVSTEVFYRSSSEMVKGFYTKSSIASLDSVLTSERTEAEEFLAERILVSTITLENEKGYKKAETKIKE